DDVDLVHQRVLDARHLVLAAHKPGRDRIALGIAADVDLAAGQGTQVDVAIDVAQRDILGGGHDQWRLEGGRRWRRVNHIGDEVPVLEGNLGGAGHLHDV